ncbi:MAG: hypothetical protein SFX73_29370 [Kofleriaceae bacterium]|nr:hypothetical protein [Kofleriaceae bacterium]
MKYLAFVVLVECASPSPSAKPSPPPSPSPPRVDAAPRDELTTIPGCDALPPARPPGVVMRVIQIDGKSLERTLDAALVADAACPTSYVPPAPACVRLADDAMDYVWRELRALKPEEIVLEPHGMCIHCGGATIAVTWPAGSCERGMGHEHGVASSSYPRFHAAVQLLEAAAAAAGVVRK